MARDKIQPVILSGGTGSRLWPLSRSHYPKQVQPLASAATMIQETARRIADGDRFEAPLIVCNQAHRFIIAEQLRALNIAPRSIVLEPMGRNTAAAAAIAALYMLECAPDQPLFLMPSDHVIANFEAFLPDLERAHDAARQGALVTFGLMPSRPETGYGYIQRGEALICGSGAHHVARFIEKPDALMAEHLIRGGDCYWNSGMFLFTAQSYLVELERYSPAILAACRAALAAAHVDLDFVRLDENAFAAAAAISIDYAVMEKTDHAAVVATEITWSDVGSWTALWQIGDKDAGGNVTDGDVHLTDVKNSYIRSTEQLVAAIGLEDIILVATEDAILAAAKDRAQDVKALVEELDAAGRREAAFHKTVYRPWGHYRTIQSGPRFQVKQITVAPGAKLSLQMHHHRAEHWVVVTGTALVTRGNETMVLGENESTYIPLGVKHRLENPGKVALHLIEVQSGGYLDEDDIVRFDDDYGRGT